MSGLADPYGNAVISLVRASLGSGRVFPQSSSKLPEHPIKRFPSPRFRRLICLPRLSDDHMEFGPLLGLPGTGVPGTHTYLCCLRRCGLGSGSSGFCSCSCSCSWGIFGVDCSVAKRSRPDRRPGGGHRRAPSKARQFYAALRVISAAAISLGVL